MKLLVIKKKNLLFILFTLCILFLLYIHYLASIQINCSSNYIFSFHNINSSNVSIFQNKIDSIYSSDEKIAFLTFDDGPTKIATTKVLDTLKENDVKASFFVIGYRVNEFPQIVKREYEEGHFVANHGYTHKNSKLYQNKDSFINEILDTDTAISEAIGVSNYHSHLFRFPNGSNGTSYASIKKKCKEYLTEIGYCYVDWNALNNDSITKYSSYQLLNNLKATCKDKNSLIILMHDTSDVSKSYESLDDSIKFLKEQGYTFKTFQELLY